MEENKKLVNHPPKILPIFILKRHFEFGVRNIPPRFPVRPAIAVNSYHR